MPLIRKTGNVLDAQTDALLIAVDGDHKKLVGAVGQQLARRIDDEREWERILAKLDYPIGPGAVRVVDMEKIPEAGFKFVLFANMFNHHNTELYLARAYHNALASCRTWNIQSLATALYRGGWRGNADIGTAALGLECSKVPDIAVEVWELAARPAP